jgi:hypothetical protein
LAESLFTPQPKSSAVGTQTGDACLEGPFRIARDYQLRLNNGVKVGVLIFLLSVSVAASQGVPNKTLTLTWDASSTTEVKTYRVYEVVKSDRVLIGESKTTQLIIPRKSGNHVYLVTAVSAKGESEASKPLQVRN